MLARDAVRIRGAPDKKEGAMLRKAQLLAGCLLGVCSVAGAQTREKGPWWPNARWGAGDQAGASNWITPEKVLAATSLVKTGKVVELGYVYERGMPLIGNRSYNIFIPSFPTSGPFNGNNIVFNDEYVAAEIGQVGTQFDGPGHVGQKMKLADGTDTDRVLQRRDHRGHARSLRAQAQWRREREAHPHARHLHRSGRVQGRADHAGALRDQRRRRARRAGEAGHERERHRARRRVAVQPRLVAALAEADLGQRQSGLRGRRAGGLDDRAPAVDDRFGREHGRARCAGARRA